MTRHSFLLGGLTPLLLLAAACSSASQPPAAAPAATAKSEVAAPGGTAASMPGPSAPPTPMPTAMQMAMAAPEPFLFASEGRILVAKPDGAPDRTLTEGVWAGSPAWSPDRSRVAYVVLYPPEAKGTYVVKGDGSGKPVKVAPYGVLDNPPVWSPDGLQLAIREKAGANQGIWTVNADGTGLTRLFDKNVSDLAWSPDGWSVAFSYNERPTSGGVYAVSAYGGATPRLVAPLLRAGGLAYSPDGKYIAVRSQSAEGSRILSKVKGTGQLHVINVAGGEMTQVATGLAGDAWRPAWANPYSIAVIQEGEGGQALAVVSRTGEAMSVLAQGSQFQGLSWSKDGSALQFSVTTVDGTFPMRVTLQEIGMAWTMDMDMTRNMKLDQGQMLKDGKMQPWQMPMMASTPATAATPAPAQGTPGPPLAQAPSTGVRIARLTFDKYT